MPPAMTSRPLWHMKYLDALRGLAVLAVLTVHVGQSCNLSEKWAAFTFTGQRGVQLFFVVSAFTLALSSEKRGVKEHRPTVNFFLRRFFRIAPMYYVAILLAVFFAPEVAGTKMDLLLGFLFLQGLTYHSIVHVAIAAWSVADEALFYCCLPFLLRQIRSARAALTWFCIAAPTLTVLSMVLTHRRESYEEFFAFLWFPIELPVFLLGLAAYFFWKEKIASRYKPSSPSAKRLSAMLMLLFVVIFYLNIPSNNRKLLLGSLGCAVLVLALALHPWRLFVNQVTVFLGKISFSFYLLHAWVLTYLVRWTPQLAERFSPLTTFAMRYVAACVATAVAASITWLYVEEPGIRLGRRLIAALEHRAADRHAQLTVPLSALRGPASAPDEQF